MRRNNDRGTHGSNQETRAGLGSAAPIVILTGSSMLALLGCSAVATSPFATFDWPTQIPSGLCIVEVGTKGSGTRCTGTVFKSIHSRSYALTAKHCFDHRQGIPLQASVLMPATESGSAIWRKYPIRRVLVPRGSSVKRQSEDHDVIWRQDWAIVEIESSDPPLSVARLIADAGNADPPWRQVSLTSFFDKKFDHFYPHVHEFKLDDVPADVMQRGHSGAPILSNGKIVAVFSGYWETRTLLIFPSRTIALTSVKTIRRQLNQCKLTLEFDSLSLPSSAADACELMHLIPDDPLQDTIPKVG